MRRMQSGNGFWTKLDREGLCFWDTRKLMFHSKVEKGRKKMCGAEKNCGINVLKLNSLRNVRKEK